MDHCDWMAPSIQLSFNLKELYQKTFRSQKFYLWFWTIFDRPKRTIWKQTILLITIDSMSRTESPARICLWSIYCGCFRKKFPIFQNCRSTNMFKLARACFSFITTYNFLNNNKYHKAIYQRPGPNFRKMNFCIVRIGLCLTYRLGMVGNIHKL